MEQHIFPYNVRMGLQYFNNFKLDRQIFINSGREYIEGFLKGVEESSLVRALTQIGFFGKEKKIRYLAAKDALRILNDERGLSKLDGILRDVLGLKGETQ